MDKIMEFPIASSYKKNAQITIAKNMNKSASKNNDFAVKKRYIVDSGAGEKKQKGMLFPG